MTSPGGVRYTPDDLRIQIPDDTDTSDEEIHRLTCRKSRDYRDSESSSDESSDQLSPEDAIQLSELEKVREESHREVEMYLLRAPSNAHSDIVSPNPSQSGDEVWSGNIGFVSSAEKMPTNKVLSADDRLLSDPAGQNEEYFHRVVPICLPFRENMKHGRRYRRYKNKAKSVANRLSESLKRYAQYQNIWANIYDEQNIEDISAMAEFDPNGPFGYIAPLVCPIPGEDSEGEGNGMEESASSGIPINPIIEAVLNQNLTALKECFEKEQGDINAPIDEGGWTSLHFAVRLSNVELCRMLLSHGASVVSRDTVEHWTPLHVAAMTCDISADVLKLLLEHVRESKRDAYEKDVHGRTALHLCLLSACKKLAERELNNLLDQKIMDDFHYFLLRAGDWSIWNTIPKRTVQEIEDPSEENADVVPFPVSDSQHTLTAVLQDSVNLKDSEQLGQTRDGDMSPEIPTVNNSGTDASDSSTGEKIVNYDPDQSSEAMDSDDKEHSVSRSLPLELLDDDSLAEEPPGQISLPLCTIPEEKSMEMTARYVTTTMTFQQNKDIDYAEYNRERFEYQSDDSSIEDCVAVLETFDLSSDDERAVTRQQLDQTQLLIIYEKIRLLLDYGFHLNEKDNKGDSILHYVAWIDNLDIFKYVIDHSTNIDLNNDTNYEGQTMLHMACLSGFPEIIRLLLDMGGDLNALDHYGNTPVDMFITEHIRKKDHMITPWLRSKEIQSKYSDDICLEMMELFSGHGCIVSKLATLDHLLVNMPLDKLEDLIRKNPKLLDFNARNFQLQTLIHVASLRKYDDDQVGLISLIVGFLVENGVKVNEKDINGRTALHLACWQRNKAIIKTLLTHGADTNLCDKFGQSCLHYTVMEMSQSLPNWSSFSAFQAALSCLADPLHAQKLIEYQLDILELLLAHDANIQQADCHGRTPLHRAITDADKAVVAYLVSEGADLNAGDANGLSPSVYILKLHRNELFHLIISAGKTTKPAYDKCNDLPPFRRQIIPAIEEQPDGCEFDTLEHIRRMRGDIDKFTKKLLTTPGIGHVVFEGENASIRAEVFLLMQRLSSALGDIDERLSASVHIAGSVREDTKVGQPNGFDYIFELINLKERFEITNPVRQSNFVSLKLKDDIDHDRAIISLCDGQGILRGSMLASVFGSSVLRALSKSSMWTDLQFIWEDDMELGANFVTFPCVLQLRWMGPKYRDLLINIDIVPAVCVPHAGVEKKEFRIQTRTKCTSTVCPQGNTVLIKWQGDLINDSDLQLSFFDAEGQVFHNISNIIKDGYRLAKIVCTTGLCQNEGSGVDAFLLKTVLFWLLYPQGDISEEADFSWICPVGDKLPVSRSSQKWTEVRWIAYHLFDRLESHLFTEYLASFFVPAENVLSFTSNSLDQMIDMCMAAKAVLSDPD